jgi:hypothetical protein
MKQSGRLNAVAVAGMFMQIRKGTEYILRGFGFSFCKMRTWIGGIAKVQ